MQHKNIHWFPGHMQKALKEIEERIRIVDVVIELLDARAPFSSRNHLLYQATSYKKRLIVLTKIDLADPILTAQWTEFFIKQNNMVLPLNLKNDKELGQLKKKVLLLGKEKQEKNARKGMKPQPIRAMVIGIPNVGKSTLINFLSKKGSASVQNTPGHTRAQQWIKVGADFELLDTPGVLPAIYKEQKIAENLALVGAIKQDILPIEHLSNVLLDFLRCNYPKALLERYSVELAGEEHNHQILVNIARRRGFLVKDGFNVVKAENLLIKEFKDGLLGQITLEKVGEADA